MEVWFFRTITESISLLYVGVIASSFIFKIPILLFTVFMADILLILFPVSFVIVK